MTYVQTQAAQAARFYAAADAQKNGFVGGWATFGEIPPEASVCHTCDNPPCFLTGHLVLGTHQQNIADRVAKGRSASTLTESIVRAILDTYYATNLLQKEIAERFGVSKQQVNRIVLGRRWAHLWRAA